MLDGKAEEQHYTVLTPGEIKWLMYIGCYFFKDIHSYVFIVRVVWKFETSCWLQKVLGDHYVKDFVSWGEDCFSK